MSHDHPLRAIFDPPSQRGRVRSGAQIGVPPPPPTGVWVRDDRYFPGGKAGRRITIPTTNAVIQLTDWTNNLIANYGQLSLLATADATGVLDNLVLPTQTTRRIWGATAAAGTKVAIAGHSYDNVESSVPARLYDLSDPSNITLITNKSVGPFGVTNQMSLMGGCLDPNNVYWFPHQSGSTTRMVGSDFDTANVTDYGPFNLSHGLVVVSSSIIDRMWLNGGSYYGAIAGRQTISIFSTAGIAGSVSMGVGATSANRSVNLVDTSLVLVLLQDSTDSHYKIKGIDVSTPASPSVAWTYDAGTGFIGFVGCPDTSTVIIAKIDRYEWIDLTTRTITHTLLYGSAAYATGGSLLTDGSIAAFGSDAGIGDGIIFIPSPIDQPSPNRDAGPRPWRDNVTEPSTGLGTPIIEWDSRLLSSIANGATFPNTGSGGTVFDLKIIDGGPGSGIYAKKTVNWGAPPSNFGPNSTLPSEADFGGDWSAGPWCMIYALPVGHRTHEETLGFTEIDVIPGDGGAYDFVGMSAEGFAFGGGFSGVYGASLGDSINDGTFFESYWNETVTNPLMDQDDVNLLVCLYVDVASRSFGTWIVDDAGVHEIVHQDNAYEGLDANEYSATAGTWPCPEFDSQGTTASDLFLFFGDTYHDTAVAGNPWDGVVWARFYRGRPSSSELLTLYADI